jgi:hypothetical protein
LRDSSDGDDRTLRRIRESIQKLDQQNTTICLEAENVLPSPRTTYCSRNIKQILSKTCHLRLEIRRCKKHNNLDNLKLLIMQRSKLNQQLIYATKNQCKDYDSQELEEIEKIKTLEPDDKDAARTLLMQRKWKQTRNLFQKIVKYTGKAKLKEAIKLQVGDKWIEYPDDILNEIVAHNKVHFSQTKGCALSCRSLQRVTDPKSFTYFNNLPELEQKFIQEMSSFQNTPICKEIEIEVWKHEFKTWRETI